MNKLKSFMLPSLVTLGVGALAIFGNGVIASQAMDTGINSESLATSKPDVANIDVESKENTQEDESRAAVLALSIEDDDVVILDNGDKVPLKDYLEEEIWNDKEVEAFNKIDYIEGQPGTNDISSETAIDTGKKELIEKYALKSELYEKFEITTKYYTKYEDISVPCWWVNFYPINRDEFSEIGCYQAILDASTGEVIQLLSAADGKG